jgi:hypothetical protein
MVGRGASGPRPIVGLISERSLSRTFWWRARRRLGLFTRLASGFEVQVELFLPRIFDRVVLLDRLGVLLRLVSPHIVAITAPDLAQYVCGDESRGKKPLSQDM